MKRIEQSLLILKCLWKRQKKYIYKHLPFFVFGTVIFLWAASWAYIRFRGYPADQAGQFGDKFGFINSLFSGLAFGGVVVSLFMQRDDLALQRQELKETRDEFKQQNFESTFFNLLKNQQEISKRIKAQFYGLSSPINPINVQASGLEFFYYSKRQLELIFLALEKEKFNRYDAQEIEYIMRYEEDEQYPPDNIEEINARFLEDTRKTYAINIYGISEKKHGEYKSSDNSNKLKLVSFYFFKKYHQFIGNYFRHFYHILKFIDESALKELSDLNQNTDTEKIIEIGNKYKRYAQFLQAQMTSDELMLLFYHCSCDSETLTLVSKYDIMEHLAIEDIVSISHNCLMPITLKNRNSIM